MIEEAIRELKELEQHHVLYSWKSKRKAIQLGIEALELYYELRGCTAIDVEDIPSHLPSEGEK